MDMRTLYLIVPLAPLVGAIVVGLFGPKLGRSLSHWLCIVGVAVSFVASIVIWRDVNAGHVFNGDVYTWMQSGGFKLSVGFLIDPLTALMLLVVTFVSLMVHIYTIGYMADDDGYILFFSYISLFTFSMLMLVMSNNFLQLFFGWEAVGLVSYLLIGFYKTRESAIYANLKAFLVNRVGDFGFVLGHRPRLRLLRHARLRAGLRRRRRVWPAPTINLLRRRAVAADGGDLHLPLRRGDGQVGAGAAARVAARLDGRPDADLRADPRGDDGDGRHLHGRADEPAVRALRRRALASSP